MSVNEKMTAIAEAIRSKTGKTDALTLDEMPVEIAGIRTGGGGGDPDENLFKYLTGELTRLDDDRLTDWKETPMIDYVRLAGITVIPHNFKCKNAKVLVIPNATNAGVSCMGFMPDAIELHLPKVKGFGNNCGNGLTKLVKADFGSVENLGNYFFNNASALETLIIRTNTVCVHSGGSILKNSGVEKGTGYIYVPSVLIEEYKVATNWSVYADQFRAIEDYPEICGEVLT